MKQQTQLKTAGVQNRIIFSPVYPIDCHNSIHATAPPNTGHRCTPPNSVDPSIQAPDADSHSSVLSLEAEMNEHHPFEINYGV